MSGLRRLRQYSKIGQVKTTLQRGFIELFSFFFDNVKSLVAGAPL